MVKKAKCDKNRRKRLVNYVRNLVKLNPGAPLNQIMTFSLSANRSCEDPIPEKDAERIIMWCWKKEQSGELLVYPKKKYGFINPESNLTKSEIGRFGALVAAKVKRSKTDKKILEGITTLYNLGKKITIKSTHEVSGVSEATVKKHWSKFKDDVKIMNENIKSWENDPILIKKCL